MYETKVIEIVFKDGSNETPKSEIGYELQFREFQDAAADAWSATYRKNLELLSFLSPSFGDTDHLRL